MKHIMLDIETLSTNTSLAVITQIGAVKFNAAGIDRKQFHLGLDVDQQLAWGRVIDADTLAWWDTQDGSPYLRNYFTVPRVLTALNRYIGSATRIWANGTVFDIGNLNSLYNMAGMSIPWPYNSATDMRTLRRYLGLNKESVQMPNHVAVDDAYHQAAWVIEVAGDKLDGMCTSD